MTFKIARSVIRGLPFDYAEAVEAFRQEKLAHRFTGDAAPHAHSLVEQAIGRVSYLIEDQKPDDFVADFEIIEDLPPPPTPAERKAALLAELRSAEQAALASVISPARARQLMLDIADIKTDQAGKLTADDQALVDRQAAIVARQRDVQRYFVNLELELEDLADDAVDGWTFKPFGGN